MEAEAPSKPACDLIFLLNRPVRRLRLSGDFPFDG
jgi:hypothetical protein